MGPNLDIKEQVRQLIIEIYTKHNPEKLYSVDSLLDRCDGHEELLYNGICEKYGEIPQYIDPGCSKEFSVADYRSMVEDIFREKNPSKLTELDNLMKKYDGKEEMLYLACCDKYQVPKMANPTEWEKVKKEKKRLALDLEKKKKKKKLGLDLKKKKKKKKKK